MSVLSRAFQLGVNLAGLPGKDPEGGKIEEVVDEIARAVGLEVHEIGKVLLGLARVPHRIKLTHLPWGDAVRLINVANVQVGRVDNEDEDEEESWLVMLFDDAGRTLARSPRPDEVGVSPAYRRGMTEEGTRMMASRMVDIINSVLDDPESTPISLSWDDLLGGVGRVRH